MPNQDRQHIDLEKYNSINRLDMAWKNGKIYKFPRGILRRKTVWDETVKQLSYEQNQQLIKYMTPLHFRGKHETTKAYRADPLDVSI